MTQAKRAAPHTEWVDMYRRGVPTSKIAALEGMAVTTIRYHLQIAARTDPGIRVEHTAALTSAKPRTPVAGLRNLNDVIAFFQAKGRLPATGGKTPRERALGVWLLRRRQEAAAGTLSSAYRDGLGAIPGWDSTSTRKADDQARWQQRLEELQKLRASGGDWPRHQKTDDTHERTQGVWLHGQRIDYRAGRLDPDKEKTLNELLPGWREGRGHRGGRREGQAR
ncbi:helicase associated domain-containing protein [Pseudarthrobacter sp. AB1]|uniref:helicase associated domain-containing protein n=1 Tax=Pseudarthrobacter sp. AB1 TaxID=2138309 RepID=UPI00186B7E0E|nr:helicase associated domain-containing protein [Pseudarthrobacter sp. AB1]MBE4720513.1 helicase-associated protein [Pseudarthrobacter sp. AB1]